MALANDGANKNFLFVTEELDNDSTTTSTGSSISKTDSNDSIFDFEMELQALDLEAFDDDTSGHL